jgi:hypothetical protein
MRHPKSARVLTRASLALIVCALLAGGRGAAASGVYEPAGGGFAATFPGTPEKSSRKQNYDTFALTVSAYGLDHEGMSYFVTWVGEVPAAAMRDPQLEEIFYTRMEQDLILTAKAANKGDLSVATRSNISLGGFGGRQYVFNSQGLMGVLRIYKVGQRFYTVGVFGDKNGFSAQRAVAFLESFKFTGKK